MKIIVFQPALAAVLSLAMVAGAVPARAGTYVYTTIALPSGNQQAYPVAINNAGQFVANYPTGYVWSNGTYTALFLKTATTGMVAINDNGIAVGGVYQTSSFSYNIATKKTTALKNPKKIHLLASALNNAGEIVGMAKGKKMLLNGFYTDGSQIEQFTVPGFTLNFPSAIDDSGNIFGYVEDQRSNTVHGFTDLAGTITTFDVPGATSTYITAISNGAIIGSFDLPNSSIDDAFTMVNGTITKYECPNANTPGNYTRLIGSLPTGGVAGQCLTGGAGGAAQPFVDIAGQMYPIRPPGAVTSRLAAMSSNGTLLGSYYDGTTNYFFTATCPANQVPCTK